MSPCDNKQKCHNPILVSEDECAARVGCTECKHQYTLRKDWRGVYENRAYAKVYKRDILQGSENLFYKYHSEHLRT